MQVLEILFCIAVGLTGVRLFTLADTRHFSVKYVALAAAAIGCIGLFFEGFRWQMIPAYFVFLLIVLAIRKAQSMRPVGRMAWLVLSAVCLGLSGLLGYGLPVVTLPEPEGPNPVGTFSYSITDNSRADPFAPHRSREVYVRVWYPADKRDIDRYPMQTLYRELYSGDFDLVSFLFIPFSQIQTHSHVEARVADDGPHQALLFNHGLFGWVDQNTQLMEHLASNGYVILSVGHPFQSLKINLPQAGTALLTFRNPKHPALEKQTSINPFGETKFPLWSISGEHRTKALRTFFGLLDRFTTAPDEMSRRSVVDAAITSGELDLVSRSLVPDDLYSFLVGSLYTNYSVQIWVEDSQFILDNLQSIPFTNFAETLDTQGFGVLGMSFGGAAAGEFCKIDPRCLAGSNLDGTQWGSHWATPLKSPFLMLTRDGELGKNNFAYHGRNDDFFEYSISDTKHLDFMELQLTAPIYRRLGLLGEIEPQRFTKILNTLQLQFFDHYLKRKSSSFEVTKSFVELRKPTNTE